MQWRLSASHCTFCSPIPRYFTPGLSALSHDHDEEAFFQFSSSGQPPPLNSIPFHPRARDKEKNTCSFTGPEFSDKTTVPLPLHALDNKSRPPHPLAKAKETFLFRFPAPTKRKLLFRLPVRTVTKPLSRIPLELRIPAISSSPTSRFCHIPGSLYRPFRRIFSAKGSSRTRIQFVCFKAPCSFSKNVNTPPTLSQLISKAKIQPWPLPPPVKTIRITRHTLTSKRHISKMLFLTSPKTFALESVERTNG